MTLEAFIDKLKSTPQAIAFAETMAVIETYYNFEPTAFKNGALSNGIGENSGSCKLFAFAKDQGFTEAETLACFGKYYFEEVLEDPNGNGHQNIRNFMITGFDKLLFEGIPLKLK